VELEASKRYPRRGREKKKAERGKKLEEWKCSRSTARRRVVLEEPLGASP